MPPLKIIIITVIQNLLIIGRNTLHCIRAGRSQVPFSRGRRGQNLPALYSLTGRVPTWPVIWSHQLWFLRGCGKDRGDWKNHWRKKWDLYCQCPAAKPGVKSWTDLSLAGTPSTHLWPFPYLVIQSHQFPSKLCFDVCTKLLQLCLTFATLCTVASQAPLSIDYASSNTRVGCHVLSKGSSPLRGSNLISLVSCTGRHVLYH